MNRHHYRTGSVRTATVAITSGMFLSACAGPTGPAVGAPAVDVCDLLRAIPYQQGPVLGLVVDGTADAFRPAGLAPELVDEIDRVITESSAASDAADAPVPVLNVYAVGSTNPGPDLTFPLDFPASGTDIREGQGRQVRQCVAQKVAALRPTLEGSPILRRVNEAVAAEPDLVSLHVSTPGTSNVASPDLREVPFEASASQIADDLQRAGELPSLEGLPVTFHYLGVTSAGRLPESDVRWLTGIWLEVCRVSGGVCRSSTQVTAPSEDPAPADLPVDPTVSVPKAAVPVPAEQDQPSLCNISEGIAATALFRAGSNELVPGAEEVLASAVDTLGRSPELTLQITGHTAMAPSSTETSRQQLSAERAANVLEALVVSGVDRSRLTSRGVGATERLVEDLGAEGQLLEPEASRNRRVTLDYACPTATP